MLRLSGSVKRRCHGKYPSVAINDHGTVIEVHQPFITSSDILSQIGRTVNGDEVDYAEERRVDSGKFPKVTINNDNRVVEVHEGKYFRRIYYNIGTVNNQLTRVNWKPKPDNSHIGRGRFPAVAMTGNRVVITYCDRAYLVYYTYYRIGAINAQETIDWKAEQRLFDSGVTETSIAMNENHAVVSGRGWFKIIYRVGQFRDGAINWSREINYTVLGYCPTVCLNNNGDVIMVWQSHRFIQLSYAVGRINAQQQEMFIEWHAQEGRNYGSGYNPSVAISPNNNQVLEEHETNYTLLQCTLRYHTGVLNHEFEAQEQAVADDENRPGAQPQIVPRMQLAARDLSQQPGNNLDAPVAIEMNDHNDQ